MGWDDVINKPASVQQQLPLGLSTEESRVMELLQAAPLLIDELSAMSDIPQSKLAIHLLNLEMQGLLLSMPGKRYKLH